MTQIKKSEIKEFRLLFPNNEMGKFVRKSWLKLEKGFDDIEIICRSEHSGHGPRSHLPVLFLSPIGL